MKLEDEIVQKKFKSEQEKAIINIFYTNNWLQNKYLCLFKTHDITHQQYNILRILRGQFPNSASIKLLKERMLDKMSDASRLVDKLVKKNFVKRHENKADRRSVDVIISEKGLKLLDQFDFLEDEAKKIMKPLSSDELKELNRLLDKIRD